MAHPVPPCKGQLVNEILFLRSDPQAHLNKLCPYCPGFAAKHMDREMTQTPNLSLPYIAASQAQKHVTHNDALYLLDIIVQLGVQSHESGTPPASPMVTERHIVGAGGSAEWAGHDNDIAVYEGPGWHFVTPVSGMMAFDLNATLLIVFDGVEWSPVPAALTAANFENLAGIGVNAASDATNRLALSAPATLFNHEGGGH